MRSQREARGWTQATLAARTGYTERTIRRIEQGEVRRPSGGTLRTLARELGIDIEILTRALEMDQDRDVFLITGKFDDEWQVELNFNLSQYMQLADLRCAQFVPREHVYGEHQQLARRVLDDRKKYAGGFFVMGWWPENEQAELLDLCKLFAKPIVFIDQNPFIDEESLPANACFVSVDDGEGGRHAAKAVIADRGGEPVHRILVMAGKYKTRRQAEFARVVKDRWPSCEVFVSEGGDFDRYRVEALTSKFLREALASGSPYEYVFCTADCITLGCHDAIERISDWGNHAPPRMIGYDGAAATRHLLENGASRLIHIVLQDAQEVARAAVNELLSRFSYAPPRKVIRVPSFLLPGRSRLS